MKKTSNLSVKTNHRIYQSKLNIESISQN